MTRLAREQECEKIIPSCDDLMFFLVVISDSIRIPPEGFTTALAAVTYEIEGKYTNQV